MAWGLAIPVLVLTTVLFYSVGVGRMFATEPFRDAMTVHVTGNSGGGRFAI